MESPQQSTNILDQGRMITSEELAAFLADTPVTTLDQWARRGGGPPFHKVGVRRLYDPADVREWLKNRRHDKRKASAA